MIEGHIAARANRWDYGGGGSQKGSKASSRPRQGCGEEGCLAESNGKPFCVEHSPEARRIMDTLRAAEEQVEAVAQGAIPRPTDHVAQEILMALRTKQESVGTLSRTLSVKPLVVREYCEMLHRANLVTLGTTSKKDTVLVRLK